VQASSPQRSGRRREYDLAGCALLIFGGLNLNGLILMFIKESALLSPLVLVFVLVLWLRYTRPVAVSELLVLFMTFMVSFLASATVISLINGSFETTYLTIYSATLLLISGVYFWLFGCTDAEFEKVLRLFKGILLVACALVPMSPYITPYLDFKGPEGRSTGLFGSPNDAGVAALYCLVLIAAYPAKSRLVTAIHTTIALVALALTFSKAGILCLGLLIMFILVERRSVKLIVLAIVAFAIAGFALQYLFDHDLFSLNREQRERIADVLALAGGEVSMRATTGRTILWETGMWRIQDQLPYGSGLGSFHSLEGGSRGDINLWLGVHNTFLMIIGEAGLVPFAIFMTFLARLFIIGAQAKDRLVAVGFGVVFVVDMLSSHSTFAFRLSNVALAIAIAVGARGAFKRKQAAALAATAFYRITRSRRRIAANPAPVDVLRSAS
jgi:O-antigen ligase